MMGGSTPVARGNVMKRSQKVFVEAAILSNGKPAVEVWLTNGTRDVVDQRSKAHRKEYISIKEAIDVNADLARAIQLAMAGADAIEKARDDDLTAHFAVKEFLDEAS